MREDEIAGISREFDRVLNQVAAGADREPGQNEERAAERKDTGPDREEGRVDEMEPAGIKEAAASQRRVRKPENWQRSEGRSEGGRFRRQGTVSGEKPETGRGSPGTFEGERLLRSGLPDPCDNHDYYFCPARNLPFWRTELSEDGYVPPVCSVLFRV